VSELFPEDELMCAALDEVDFLDHVEQLPKSLQRMVAILLKRVALVEDQQGEDAALALIDDVSCILMRTETTH